jgi:WD40 repeat protein
VVRLREAATGKEVRSFDHEIDDWIELIAFSPDGKTLASACGREVRVWDVASGKPIVKLQGNQERRCFAFSPDGRTLALGAGSEAKPSAIRVFDVPSGKEQQGFGRGIMVNALAFSPDGRCLAAADELHAVRLWDFASRKERISFPHGQELKVEEGRSLFQDSLVTSVAFSPDGRWLLAGYHTWMGQTAGANVKGESYALLWDVWTGERAGRFSGHGGTVSSVAFAPDGKTCATGSQDTTALVWDVAARLRQRKPRRLGLTAEELNRLWNEVQDADAAKAHRAMGILAASPEKATRLVKDRLPPAAAADPKRVAALIADLDNNSFAVREKSMQALEKLGASAEGGLRRALSAKPSPEAARRMKQLLDKLKRLDQFLVPRGVEVVERIGTREAQRVLEAMARGMPESRLTVEAKAALARLEKWKTPK